MSVKSGSVARTLQNLHRFRVLGVNDDKDFCECCGKSGLKRVVWIEDTESGEVSHFGTTCAMHAKHGFGMNGAIRDEIKKYEGREQMISRIAWNDYRRVRHGPVEITADAIRATDPALWAACRAAARARVADPS